jgi:hypothetical protein
VDAMQKRLTAFVLGNLQNTAPYSRKQFASGFERALSVTAENAKDVFAQSSS